MCSGGTKSSATTAELSRNYSSHDKQQPCARFPALSGLPKVAAVLLCWVVCTMVLCHAIHRQGGAYAAVPR